MGRTLSRRTVYAATILTILVMSGGFVLATVLSGITITQTGQNAGSITAPTNSIFATTGPVTLQITLVQATAVGCGASATWVSTATTATVYMSGTAPCTSTANDWFEELTWQHVPSTGVGQSDTFFITSTYTGGAGSTAVSFTISDTTVADPAFSGTLNVFLDAGTSAGGALPNAYTGVDIAVSGT
jgi:hypothetical protein